MNCSMERVSRMEKAFYPRNDTVNATISRLLPRDGTEDILIDAVGDEVYLERSSILDGVNIKGFGYVDNKPYKWYLEIDTAVKSIAVVPDRFYSIYGKSYPIMHRQTVGINQPSEFFKYEIVYKRGPNQPNQGPPVAKIIYHAQAEGKPIIDNCAATTNDELALKILDDFEGYPYLKIRVCLDGSVKAYLGDNSVDWDLEREIGEFHKGEAVPDSAWVEIPQINTDQFRNIDLWLRFDSINALSYYLITKYEDNIFDIGPKEIKGGLDNPEKVQFMPYVIPLNERLIGIDVGTEAEPNVITQGTLDAVERGIDAILANRNFNKNEWLSFNDFGTYIDSAVIHTAFDAALPMVVKATTIINNIVNDVEDEPYGDNSTINWWFCINSDEELCVSLRLTSNSKIKYSNPGKVAGISYTLEDSTAVADSDCTPCCKKANLSRSIWAYVNPRTMTPYDDDYWFHQGEPYYKKSLTLSTKQNPLKAQKIFVEQGVFPGMYKIVCETYIRNRDTGEDERVQISLPLCKIKSDQTLTLSADGDPTTFNLDVEVATPPNGIPAEITFYEVEKEMKQGCAGGMIAKDGSTKIVAK